MIPFKTEPTLVITFVMAFIGLLIAYGVTVTLEQQNAIKVVLTEFFALMVASGIIVRSHVSPSDDE